MNEKIITTNITTSIKEARREADRFNALADALEKATNLLGVSPTMASIAKSIRRAGNTANRLSETQRNQLDTWLKGGQKAVSDICKSLGISRCRAYQRRDELGLDTYKKVSAAGAGK